MNKEFDSTDSAELMDDVEHYNDEHADTVLFVTRFAGGHSDAVGARIAVADHIGLTVEVELADGGARRHVPFESPAASLAEARAAMYGLLSTARARAGESVPLTSLEREIVETSNLPTFHSEVSAVHDLSPRMREITLTGGLEGFTPKEPDQFLLVTLADHVGDEPARAYYTVRRWRREQGEIDMWFVLHDHRGPLSGWAATAKPGDRVSLWGPRSSYSPPAEATSLLLVADDTGLPAVAAILESTDLPAHVVVETYDPDHAVGVAPRPGVTVDWLYRGDEAPGLGTRLVDSVRSLDVDRDHVYAFGAAESRQITRVRSHLRQERGMAVANVQMIGYWRRQLPRSR